MKRFDAFQGTPEQCQTIVTRMSSLLGVTPDPMTTKIMCQDGRVYFNGRRIIAATLESDSHVWHSYEWWDKALSEIEAASQESAEESHKELSSAIHIAIAESNCAFTNKLEDSEVRELTGEIMGYLKNRKLI